MTTVADLGFPRGGGVNSPGGGGRQHTILPNFPKNCMKLKEFGPPGGRGSRPKFYYIDPPLDHHKMTDQSSLSNAKFLFLSSVPATTKEKFSDLDLCVMPESLVVHQMPESPLVTFRSRKPCTEGLGVIKFKNN